MSGQYIHFHRSYDSFCKGRTFVLIYRPHPAMQVCILGMVCILGWSLKNQSWKCFPPSRLFRYIGWENNIGTILLESDNVYPPLVDLKVSPLTLWQYNVNLGGADASPTDPEDHWVDCDATNTVSYTCRNVIFHTWPKKFECSQTFRFGRGQKCQVLCIFERFFPLPSRNFYSNSRLLGQMRKVTLRQVHLSSGVCSFAIHPMVLEICSGGICPAQVNIILP